MSDLPSPFTDEERASLLAEMEQRYDQWIQALRAALPSDADRQRFDALTRAQQEAQVGEA
jgi:hypothetical protein